MIFLLMMMNHIDPSLS